MNNTGPSAAAVEAFEGVVADLAGAGVSPGMMFGARSLKLNRKAIACLTGDAMVFRLGRDSAVHARALGYPGAELFDPSGMGRPFKDWVRVPAGSAAEWPALADAALAFTGGEA
ncbi:MULTISPECIES: hypothetical protein [Arthrobacter]|uniref:TfoX N-terminal domain-containing protein n=1 Tax=Arthrobacter oryzae TaxID=409290 RepID=A0A3N0BMD8_9MICC|nr:MULTISPECIES: hypothetical protein [Arthrobacter]QYF88636.1 hypothetical protein KY499_10220 [Arthrobacter sp. PAMC25284]RNL49933.1 hypothetical protein D7003_17550 [Arthrobacter oryzae]